MDAKRIRRKSTRKLLDDSVREFNAIIADPAVKVTVKSQLLIERSSILKRLLDIEHDEATDEVKAIVEQLTAKAAEDALKIEALESQLATAQNRSQQVITRDDPDTPRLKREVEELTGIVAFIASELSGPHARACCAIRAILKYGPSARSLVQSLRLDFSFYMLGLNGNHSVENLRDMLSRCIDPENENAVYARACLEVIHECKVKPVAKRRDTQDFAFLAPEFD